MTLKKIAETDGFICYEPDPDLMKNLDPIMKISEKEMPYIFAVWGFGPLNKFKIRFNLDKIKLFSSKNQDTGKIKYCICTDYKVNDSEIGRKNVYDLNIPPGVNPEVIIDRLDKVIRGAWGDDISRPRVTDFRRCKTLDDVLKEIGLDESQIKKVMMRIPKKRKK